MSRYRLRSEAIGAAVDSATISGSARVVLHVGPFDYRVRSRSPRVHAVGTGHGRYLAPLLRSLPLSPRAGLSSSDGPARRTLRPDVLLGWSLSR